MGGEARGRSVRVKARSAGREAEATSSHASGVETAGCGRARTVYGVAVVFFAEFCDQSMNTRPVRSTLVIRETTRSGCARSNSWATRRA